MAKSNVKIFIKFGYENKKSTVFIDNTTKKSKTI
jgi:hypothetical protein